jgi:hypothetical protein
MSDKERALLAQMHREAVERLRGPPSPPGAPTTIHHTELPAARAGDPLATEWNTYRQEVGRLLAEGNANRWVLLKGEQLLGIWDTQEEALTAGYQRFLRQPFLVHQVQDCEPLLRTGPCSQTANEGVGPCYGPFLGNTLRL